MTQPNPYGNIPGFPGYPPAAAPAFPPGPVPAGIPGPVPAAIPAPVPAGPPGYPAPYAAAPAPMPVAPVYPAAPAGPVAAPYAGSAQPVAAPPPLPDLNAAIAAATLGNTKYPDLRDLEGDHVLKIADHNRRCGTSKIDGGYYDVIALDFEVVSSTNPNVTPGIKVSSAFSNLVAGFGTKHEMLRLKSMAYALSGVTLEDPRINDTTAQVRVALAALNGQKPYVGATVRASVQPQANGKINPKTQRPYTNVTFGLAQ